MGKNAEKNDEAFKELPVPYALIIIVHFPQQHHTSYNSTKAR